MNVTIEPLPHCLATLRVEIPSDQVSATRERITDAYMKQVKLPGFRPGKVPRSVVVSKFNKQIREELKEKLIQENTRTAIFEKNLRVLTIQNVNDVDFSPDDTLRYTATLVTEPEFELPEYKGIAVQIPPAEITDADVDSTLEQLRNQYADFTDVAGRALAMEDYAVIDYAGTIDGKPVHEAFPQAGKPLSGNTQFWIRMTAESFFPGFCDALAGANPGEQRAFDIPVPADFSVEEMRGLSIHYEVTVQAVKEKHVPGLDDAFADKIVTGKTLAELRELVREDLIKDRTNAGGRMKRDQIMKFLCEKVECELPQHLLRGETERMLNELVRENQSRGITDAILEENEKQLVAAASAGARDRIKGSFILSRIAQNEKLNVSREDLAQHVAAMAGGYRMPIDKMFKQIQERDAMPGIHEELLTGKALDFLVMSASVSTIQQPDK